MLQLSKTGQSGRFLYRLLGPLQKTGVSLIKNILRILAKSVLIALGLIAATSATDRTVQKKSFGPGMTTLINSNEEINDIMKIIKSLMDADLLIKSVSETMEN